jgi:hypothetical protein
VNSAAVNRTDRRKGAVRYRCRLVWTNVLATCLLFVQAVGAQDVTEASLKAAFTFNFAQFTTWPGDVLPSSAELMACVLGDNSVFDALERTARTRQLAGHIVVVTQMTSVSSLGMCHLLYVSSVPQARVAAVLSAVRGQSVLTVSDADDFAERGGIAQIFVERGKMRFDLNYGVAKRVRLQMSSRLLVLAAHVFDGPPPATVP